MDACSLNSYTLVDSKYNQSMARISGVLVMMAKGIIMAMLVDLRVLVFTFCRNPMSSTLSKMATTTSSTMNLMYEIFWKVPRMY